MIEKCSSPTGDGNVAFCEYSLNFPIIIEKCSSPTGDGNPVRGYEGYVITQLRNVVPRQGTEIIL